MLKYFLDADELTIETLPLHFVTIFNDLAKMNNITIDQALLLFKFGVQMPEQTSNKALPENSSNTTSSNNFDPEVVSSLILGLFEQNLHIFLYFPERNL